MTTIRFLKGGGVRKLFATRDRAIHNAVPRRASRVEVIDTGSQRGRFYVDFSPLGDCYQLCLRQTFEDYHEAVAAERRWLTRHWICGPVDPDFKYTFEESTE